MITTHLDHLPAYRRYLTMVRSIRSFLSERGYLELDLPVLSPALIPESYVEVFETEYRYFDHRQKLYLTPSPELFIKRLLVEGIGDSYYLGKSFRNSEPTSSKHLGEFTMLEWYKVDADYMDLADEVLALLQNICANMDPDLHRAPPVGYARRDDTQNAVIPSNEGIQSHNNIDPRMREDDKSNTRISSHHNALSLTYQGVKVDLTRWEKLTVAEAFETYAQITREQLFDHDLFRERCKEKGYQTEKAPSYKLQVPNNSQLSIINYQFTYGELWSQVYATEVEPHLGSHGYPTLLYDYPVEFAALSKPNADGKTSQRFEFYIAGTELGNCYSELADWKLQEKRLADEAALRAASHRISHPSDTGFVDALKKGLPDCAGIAIGVERLAMIFTDTKSITDLKLMTVSD
ncbi:MAG: amino acid--tRNA ligase-related protein [bacterium]